MRRLVRAFPPSLDPVRRGNWARQGRGEVCVCVCARRPSCVPWNVAFKVDLVICDEDWKKGKTRWSVGVSRTLTTRSSGGNAVYMFFFVFGILSVTEL